MKSGAVPAFAVASLLSWSGAVAGPERFPATGFVVNAAGQQCRYRQKVVSNALHFHGDAISTTIGEMTFDDPRCMQVTDDEPDAGKVAINRLIATWYSHPDADFDTEHLYKTSLYQEVGVCMQSRSYAAIGIAIDYVVEDGHIVRVFHGPTLEGCLV